MNFFETLFKRRSIRTFDESKHVSDEQIETILKAGMAAPSALNKQPWEFYVIKNKDLQNIIKMNHEYYDRNSDVMIVVCGNRKDQSKEQLLDYWVEDCSASVENMLLAATDLGLGSLWCGVFPRMERVNDMKELLNLKGDDIIPFAIIQIGYSGESKNPKGEFFKDKVHYID